MAPDQPLHLSCAALQDASSTAATTATTSSPADSSSGGCGPPRTFIDPFQDGAELSEQEVMALVAENLAADARLAGSKARGAPLLKVLQGAEATRALLCRLLRSLRWVPVLG